MDERTKKILFAVFFVVASIGLGYMLYLLFFKPATFQPQPTPTPGLGGQLPAAGPGGATTSTTTLPPGELPGSGENQFPSTVPGTTPTPATTHVLHDGITQAVSPTPDGRGARFYNPEDGRFYRVNADGTTTILSEKQFFNVQTVSWGNTQNKVVLEFPNGSNVFFDFDQNKQVVLPQHWEGFNFASDDRQIAAKSLGIDEDNRFLFISQPDGTEAHAIETLGANADRVHVDWSPLSQVVAYSETGQPQGNGQQEILFIGKNHENFKSLIVPGQGFTPNWSPNGRQLVFSSWNVSSQNKPLLWIVSGESTTIGANRRSLNIYTWADKCTWASDSDLYCAVPQNLPPNAGLQREDYASYPDDLYHISLVNGVITKINTADQNHPIRFPMISKDKKQFMFSDASNGKLYSYDL